MSFFLTLMRSGDPFSLNKREVERFSWGEPLVTGVVRKIENSRTGVQQHLLEVDEE